MKLLTTAEVCQAVSFIKKGAVVAYPTESSFSLGCDPDNIDAVSRILQVKQRALEKGFILVAASWEQVEPLINYVRPDMLTRIFETWPGSVTWLFPASDAVPQWICGHHAHVAVRVTAHPVAKMLCEHFGGPLIATSCNASGHTPACDVRTVQLTMQNTVDYVMTGEPCGVYKPTELRDAITGEILRA